MGILCSEKIHHAKSFTSISYSKLDKIIFIVQNYMNDEITENQLIKLFPLINIEDLKKEKKEKTMDELIDEELNKYILF